MNRGSGLGDGEITAWCAYRARFQRDQLCQAVGGRARELVGVPIAGDDPHAIGIASTLIRQIGFDPVVIGGLAMGKYLVPGTPLGGEHTAAEIRQIVTTLH